MLWAFREYLLSYKRVRWRINVWETLLYNINTWTTFAFTPTSGKHYSLAHPTAQQYSCTVSVTKEIPVQFTACLPSTGRQAIHLFKCLYFIGSIGRFGPEVWPARSPDLTPLDYILWGHMKDTVYWQTSQAEEKLMKRSKEPKKRDRVIRKAATLRWFLSFVLLSDT